MYFKIDTDISEDKKEKLIKMTQKYSPVFNSITKTISVSDELDKKFRCEYNLNTC